MKHAIAIAVVMSLITSNTALASEDCHSPMSQWQSREAATEHVQQMGISIDRLKIDDGCYELRGHDSDDNRVELKLDPATLALLKIEVSFRPGADPSRYLPGARGAVNKAPESPKGNPLFTPGTVPKVGGEN